MFTGSYDIPSSPPWNGLWRPSMAKKRARKRSFSAVKAVKANARERVGQPKPERVLPDPGREAKRRRKHPGTLSQLLTEDE